MVGGGKSDMLVASGSPVVGRSVITPPSAPLTVVAPATVLVSAPLLVASPVVVGTSTDDVASYIRVVEAWLVVGRPTDVVSTDTLVVTSSGREVDSASVVLSRPNRAVVVTRAPSAVVSGGPVVLSAYTKSLVDGGVIVVRGTRDCIAEDSPSNVVSRMLAEVVSPLGNIVVMSWGWPSVEGGAAEVVNPSYANVVSGLEVVPIHGVVVGPKALLLTAPKAVVVSTKEVVGGTVVVGATVEVRKARYASVVSKGDDVAGSSVVWVVLINSGHTVVSGTSDVMPAVVVASIVLVTINRLLPRRLASALPGSNIATSSRQRSASITRALAPLVSCLRGTMLASLVWERRWVTGRN